jgi:hypothetical protein
MKPTLFRWSRSCSKDRDERFERPEGTLAHLFAQRFSRTSNAGSILERTTLAGFLLFVAFTAATSPVWANYAA